MAIVCLLCFRIRNGVSKGDKAFVSLGFFGLFVGLFVCLLSRMQNASVLKENSGLRWIGVSSFPAQKSKGKK